MNIDLAGTTGWSRLPGRMEQLRRAVTLPERRLAPPAPDAERAAVRAAERVDRLRPAARSLGDRPDARAAAVTGRRAPDGPAAY
ncbi:hypothetical protein [Streptomyces virginiae]|uniref:hypothetical protein n=1 Tax=Streptomyces virginiae TaxID=1961 RepID=UPI0036FBFFB5